MTRRPTGLRARWIDFGRGLRFGYPLCCVLHFALDPHHARCKRRGLIDLGYRHDGRECRWVPCYFHQGTMGWRPARTWWPEGTDRKEGHVS